MSKRYTPEFKRDAVALVRSSGRNVTDVPRELRAFADAHRHRPGAVEKPE